MKILILYTPRSGTNSIASYFLKQNPHYEYFNQPFTKYNEEGIRHTTYDQCLKYENVLVKSDIISFIKLNIDKTQLLIDFHKVLLISRKDKREQSISFIIAGMGQNYLDNTRRSYFTGAIDDQKIEKTIEMYENAQTILEKYLDVEIPLFYYEELYYDNFSKLFEYLSIGYIDKDFKDILDIKNKYKTKDLERKKINTII